MPRDEPPPSPEKLPFPDSLCHSCAAPIRYIRNDRGSVFLLCPIFRRYPRQPVLECEKYAPIEKEPPER